MKKTVTLTAITLMSAVACLAQVPFPDGGGGGSTNPPAFTSDDDPPPVYPTSAVLKWRLDLNANCISPISVGPDGTVYLSQYVTGNNLWAVNPDMSVKWTQHRSPPLASAVVVGENGVLYVNDQSEYPYYLRALDASTGSEIWNCSIPEPLGHADGGPAIGPDGTLYVTSYKSLVAITNGAVKWVCEGTNDEYYNPTPVVGQDGTIYVNTGYGAALNAIDPNGTQKWAFYPDPPAFNSGYPSIASDGTIYCGWSTGLFAINPNGTLKWSWTNFLSSGEEFDLGCEIGVDGTIYIRSLGLTSYLYAFAPDGTVKWTFPMAPCDTSYYPSLWASSACALAADGQIFVTDLDGMVYSLAPNGSVNWSYDTGAGGLKPAVFGPDGTLYVASFDTPNLFAFQGTSLIAGSAWPEFGKNSRHTGAFAGQPAVLSFPTLQANGAALTVSGPTNAVECICASRNLVTWTNLGQIVLTNGSVDFLDTGAANYPHRFYRAVPQ